MELVADVLLVAGAFGACAYCIVLSARLRRFTTLENGMGGAIAVLSAQVDDLTAALARAQGSAGAAAEALEGRTTRAEAATARLELMLATLNDLPQADTRPPRRVILRRRPRTNVGEDAA